MKQKIIIPIAILLLTLSLHSCYDSKMKWGDPYTHPAASNLPLPLQEAISRYEVLKSYAPANFKMGVGIDFNLYTTNSTYQSTVNQNFTDITPGNELKQQSLMNAQGVLNFANADKVIAQIQAAGLSVYGHNLVWHSQQQATYLNSLIAPTVIPAPPGSSLVDGSFENGMGGWTATYYAENYSIVSTDAVDGTQSLQVIIPSDATGGKYDGHGFLVSPNFDIVNGHHYQISFWIKGSTAGQVAIDFPDANLGNQYPNVNGVEYAPVTTSWTQVVYNTTTVGGTGMIATDGSTSVRLLLASMPSVTYNIDAVSIVDLDAAPAVANFVPNGDFETGDMTNWTVANKGGGVSVTADAKYDGSYGLEGISSATSTNDWDLQFQSATMTLDPSKKYTFSFMIKSDIAGAGRISFNGNINDGSATGNQYPWMDWTGSGTSGAHFTTSSQWEQISVTIQPQTTSLQLSFDLGTVPNVTYYVDDVQVVSQDGSAPPTSGPVVISKTPEEKAAILDTVLVNYITAVVTHYQGTIGAWDVVNEPLDDNGAVRAGLEDLTQTSTFYWSYYLGKDYAVTAFKTARAADPNAKLFINDYGLEATNGTKLQGMITYVQYIESQGAKVDGIGTQMHINLSTDTTAVDKMFKALAATGKLIKISEMDVAIGSSSPTADQFAAQANLYQYVVNSYMKNVPAAQQYGITVWGVSDNPAEHVDWIPNDAPCLFDANYARKQAYKGFADGLAGEDVSAGFSGELQY